MSTLPSSGPLSLAQLLEALELQGRAAVAVERRSGRVVGDSRNARHCLTAQSSDKPLPPLPGWEMEVSRSLHLDEQRDLRVVSLRCRTKLRVCLIGGFRLLDQQGKVLAEGPERRAPWQLLLLLALSQQRPLSRRALAAQLWPGYSQESQRNNLKQATARLREQYRQAVGEGDCLAHGADGTLTCDPELVSCDVMDVLRASQRVGELRLAGRNLDAQAFSCAAFEVLLGGPRFGLASEDLHSISLLAAIQPQFERAVATLAEAAVQQAGPAETLRALEILRRASWHAPHSVELGVLAVTTLARCGQLGLAHWAYQELYLPLADRPIPFQPMIATAAADAVWDEETPPTSELEAEAEADSLEAIPEASCMESE